MAIEPESTPDTYWQNVLGQNFQPWQREAARRYLEGHGVGGERFFPDLTDDSEDTGRRFRCRACGATFEEDDLQQVQPDGHYACPFEQCGDDTIERAEGSAT